MDLNELKKNPLLVIALLVVLAVLALFVIVVVLAVLFYVGVFNVSPPPEICTFPVGMQCVSSHLSADTDKLEITVISGLQTPIIITNVSCAKTSDKLAEISQVRLATAQRASFSISCTDETGNPINFQQGDTYSGKINVQYYFEAEGPSALRRMSGNIYAKAS
jgi:hypothetical protein